MFVKCPVRACAHPLRCRRSEAPRHIIEVDVAGLGDAAMEVDVACPRFFQQWNVIAERQRARAIDGESGVMAPASSAESATAGLNVEPGG